MSDHDAQEATVSDHDAQEATVSDHDTQEAKYPAHAALDVLDVGFEVFSWLRPGERAVARHVCRAWAEANRGATVITPDAVLSADQADWVCELGCAWSSEAFLTAGAEAARRDLPLLTWVASAGCPHDLDDLRGELRYSISRGYNLGLVRKSAWVRKLRAAMGWEARQRWARLRRALGR